MSLVGNATEEEVILSDNGIELDELLDYEESHYIAAEVASAHRQQTPNRCTWCVPSACRSAELWACTRISYVYGTAKLCQNDIEEYPGGHSCVRDWCDTRRVWDGENRLGGC